MIQSVTFRVRSTDDEKFAELEDRVRRMVSLRKNVLGAQVIREGSTVALTMRMSDLDRWRIASEARKIASFMMGAVGLSFSRPLAPELVTTELTRNKLCDGEGRTPRARPPRRTIPDRVA